MRRRSSAALAMLMAIGVWQALAGVARADEALARQSGCLECHQEKPIGPSFRAMAERHRRDPTAREALARVVRQGGKGSWTELTQGVPMPPYGLLLTDQQIAALVDWVLGF